MLVHHGTPCIRDEDAPAAAVANEYFVAAINRVGVEEYGDNDFYGTSYFVDPRGQFVGEPASGHDEELLVRDLDLRLSDTVRPTWAFYLLPARMVELLAGAALAVAGPAFRTVSPGLRAALDHGLDSAGTTLVHVRTDRGANVALHRRVWDAVAESLSRPGPAAVPGA